jgi:hypothetical protein
MLAPGFRQLVCEVVHMLNWKFSQSRGEGVLPIIIRNAQSALKVDAAYCFLMYLRKTESKFVVE